jgi:hypothetical protein
MYYNNTLAAYGIIPAQHRAQFTVLNQRTVQDTSLSLKARAILVYLLAMPKDWQINRVHLMRVLGVGAHTIKKYLRELEGAGYLIRGQARGEDGRYGGGIAILRETPDCVGKVQGGEVVNSDGDLVLSAGRFCDSDKIDSARSTHIDKIQLDIASSNTNYPNREEDGVNFGDRTDERQLVVDAPCEDPPTTEPQIDPSQQSDPIRGISVAACDKMEYKTLETPTRTTTPSSRSTLTAVGAGIGHIMQSIQTAMDNVTATATATETRQPKPRLTDPERLDYKTTLGTINVHIDDVSHAIAAIDPDDRQRAVSNAIAYCVEGKSWIKDQASMFVAAIREGRMPVSARNADLKDVQRAQAALDEGKQFGDWYTRAKAARLIDYSTSDDSGVHYAMVLMLDGSKVGWREAEQLIAVLIERN